MKNSEQELLEETLNLADFDEDLEGALQLDTVVEHYEEPEEAAGRTVYRRETEVISQTWYLDDVETSEEALVKKFGKEEFDEMKLMME